MKSLVLLTTLMIPFTSGANATDTSITRANKKAPTFLANHIKITENQKHTSNWNNLLASTKKLMSNSKDNKKTIKVFISYAWEDTSNEEGKIANSKLQRYLEKLRDDLQAAGVSVFLDIGDMHGNMKLRMEENLNASDIIITINTPRFRARAVAVPQTNLGFEYQLTLEKAKSIPYGVFPLHYSGSFNDTFGAYGASDELKELKNYLIRDCTNPENYESTLVATQRPLGIIPAIYGIDCDDNLAYKKLVEIWRWKEIGALPPINPYFTGRQTLLIKLANSFTKPTKSTFNQKYLTISGMGGVGKSDVAMAFAHLHADKYQIVRWLNTEGDNIRLEFEQLASKLGIDCKGMSNIELSASVYDKLDQNKWLFIFDNADNYQSIKDYLPKQAKEGKHILITSRSQNWMNPISLDVFTEEESYKYVKSILPKVKKEEVTALSKVVGYLPLALNHSIAYIRDTGISIGSYIEIYEKRGIEFIKKYGAAGDEERYPHSVLNTIAMSMEKVKAKSPLAIKMITGCSYLNPDNIPLRLFENEALLKNVEAVHEALRVLKDYSLVEPAKIDDHIRINRLVQSVIKHEYTQKPQKNNDNIVQLLSEVSKALYDFSPWEKLKNNDFDNTRLLLPHLQTMINNLEPYAQVQKGEKNKGALIQSHLLNITAKTFLDLGDYKKAKELYEKAMIINEAYYSPNHTQVAVTLNNLGNAIYFLGDYKEAKNYYEKTLMINEKHYDKNHPEVARALQNLGNALSSLGDYKAAKKLYEQALKIEEKHYGKNHPDVARTLQNLSNTLSALGEYSEAKKLCEHALQIREKHYGPEHPEIASTLQSLGNIVVNLGDYKKAKTLFETALIINEKHYGPEHQEAVRILHNLGNALFGLEDYQGAKKLFETALHINAKHYDQNHPQLAMSLNDLGNVLAKLEDYQGAKKLYEKALHINERYYGKDHIQVALILQNLGNTLYALGDFKEAKKLHDRVSEINKKHYGDTSMEVASALFNLSFISLSSSSVY